MTEQELLESFTQILRNLLGDDSIELTMETVRSDVHDWGSFNYINFIVAVEVELNIKFKISDVESFNTVGEIVIAAKNLLH